MSLIANNIPQRVFTYNDRLGWVLNGVAFVCMVAAGTILPLMDLVFGKFINVFTDFATGSLSPAGYRTEVSKYRCGFSSIVRCAPRVGHLN
jgi:ATP-binding cassette subfamily B (MDR/TAP) protein 1